MYDKVMNIRKEQKENKVFMNSGGTFTGVSSIHCVG